jgi:hypothetical protein
MKKSELTSSEKNLYAVSGKIGSGKDTVVRALQFMTCEDPELVSMFYDNPEQTMKRYSGIAEGLSSFKNAKFAESLKLTIAGLLGVSRNTMESREFKEKELGPEWWYYAVGDSIVAYDENDYTDEEREALEDCLVKPTVRTLIVKMANEGGRYLIHPDIWVNALFSNYKPVDGEYPKWLISDMRWKNEFERVKKFNGKTIRVIRSKKLSEWLEDFAVDLEDLGGMDDLVMSDVDFKNLIMEMNNGLFDDIIERLNNKGEIDLDDVEHDYVIYNDGTITDLVNKLHEICLLEGIVLTNHGGVDMNTLKGVI